MKNALHFTCNETVICSLRAEKEAKMETREKNRKQYKKPQVRQVKLEIEEAILAGCKVTTTSSGQSNKTCNHSQCKTTQGS